MYSFTGKDWPLVRGVKTLDRVLTGISAMAVLLHFIQAGHPATSFQAHLFNGVAYVLVAVFLFYFAFQLTQLPRHLEQIQLRIIDLSILLPFFITRGDPGISAFFIIFRQIIVNISRLVLLVNFEKLYERAHPFQILSIGYVVVTLIGTLLLTLPISTAHGLPTPLIDAFFTATSAVTTTGLIVVDTGSYYSIFGQIIIMLLFQVGGLGYMIFISLMILGMGGRLSLGSRMLLHSSIGRPSSLDMIKFSKLVVKYTVIFELIGAFLLTLYFIQTFPFEHAIYLGIFHSVSAFCTAGFSIFPDSFVHYQDNIGINMILMLLGASGGLGFFVLYDLISFFKNKFKKRPLSELSVHTRFTLRLTFLLMGIGTLIIFLMEIGVPHAPLAKTFLTSAFQGVSASSTTGFNSVDIAKMFPTSIFAIIILMLIGASPGGTGGGVKTTTFGIIILFLLSTFTGKRDINIIDRHVPTSTVVKAFAIGFVSVLWLTFSVLILTGTEEKPFMDVVFEAVSAFGTVGLSTGITGALSAPGKILICLSMLIGRIGPLALGFSLVGKPKFVDYRYAEADVLVG